MKNYKPFLVTLVREAQNKIDINAKLSNIEQDQQYKTGSPSSSLLSFD